MHCLIFRMRLREEDTGNPQKGKKAGNPFLLVNRGFDWIAIKLIINPFYKIHIRSSNLFKTDIREYNLYGINLI